MKIWEKLMKTIYISKEKLENVDVFIFDKDGTIIDIHHYWCSMIKIRAEFLLRDFKISNRLLYFDLIDAMGVDIEIDKIKPTGPVGIKSRSFIIETAYKCLLNSGVKCNLEEVSAVFIKVDTYSKDIINELIKPLPGVITLLKKLDEIKMPVAIATTDLSERASMAMKCLGIEHIFSIIAGGNSVENAKPAPDLVNYICDKLALKNDRAVVLGDSIVDLKMASNAGARFIGVKTGLFSDEFISKSEYLVDNLEHIIVE
jgi:phosphoglycolate phosphatase